MFCSVYSMPPKRTTGNFQERAAKRRRTNDGTVPPSSGSLNNQQTPPKQGRDAPGPSGLSQLTPDLISAITAAVTQALQTAAAGPPIQFVTDPVAPPIHGPTPANTNEQQSSTGTRTVQDTVENVLDKLISPQETQGCQSKNTFLSSAIPLFSPRIPFIFRFFLFLLF